MPIVDLATTGVRALNQALHTPAPNLNDMRWEVLNPRGAHAVAVGVDAPYAISIDGSVGYHCAGVNRQASITVSARPGRAWPKTSCRAASR